MQSDFKDLREVHGPVQLTVSGRDGRRQGLERKEERGWSSVPPTVQGGHVSLCVRQHLCEGEVCTLASVMQAPRRRRAAPGVHGREAGCASIAQLP